MQTLQNSLKEKPKMNVGFFFMCLGLLATLITSVVSFLNLVFSTLDKKFPDVLNSTYQYGYSTYDFEAIRTALATLIIFFPVFIVVSYFWKKFIKKGIGHLDEIFRKWILYIILFISSVVIVIDLVMLVKYFISGEITNRFIYKVLSALIVAVLVGFYYLIELRNKENRKIKLGFIFGGVGIVLAIASICYSFSIMGSPQKQRLLRLDDKRITDLQNIQGQIINFWQQKEKLPKDLAELANPISGYSLPVEPEFEKGKKYEYIKKDKLKFELCAEFSLPMPKGWQEYQNYYKGGVMPMSETDNVSVSSYPYWGGGANESWDHQTGRTCFERTIDKDLYPPYPKVLKNSE